MATAKTPESQKKAGDVMESLIDRTDAEAGERNAPSANDESALERDPEDESPEDSDSDDE